MYNIKKIFKSMTIFEITLKVYEKIINIRSLKKERVVTPLNYNIKGKIYIKNCGEIIIGNNIRINSSLKSNPIGFDTRTILWTINSSACIRIGNNVGISNSSIVCMENITIEDNVLIGGGCKIYDTDFHSLDFRNRIATKDLDINTKPVLIKNGAFVGAGSIILKGVIIGEHSIIGAGSVVTKNIPKNEVWAGNPAKFIKNIKN